MLFYAGLLPNSSSISPTHPPNPQKNFGSARIPWPNTAGAGWACAHPWLRYCPGELIPTRITTSRVAFWDPPSGCKKIFSSFPITSSRKKLVEIESGIQLARPPSCKTDNFRSTRWCNDRLVHDPLIWGNRRRRTEAINMPAARRPSQRRINLQITPSLPRTHGGCLWDQPGLQQDGRDRRLRDTPTCFQQRTSSHSL